MMQVQTQIVLLISLHFLAIQVSSLHTLKQGDQLNSSTQLVSANGIFTLGFRDMNHTLLAIWFTGSSYNNHVWNGKGDKPIPRKFPQSLTLGSRGELMILYDGGERFEVYGGSIRNVTATASLLDTGNFVIRSIRGEVLWQSFDHPANTLLPGMKLGLNHRTGRNWTLSSDSRAFSLEWDPNSRMLLCRRRGVVHWRSGKLEIRRDQSGSFFENFGSESDFSIKIVMNDEEEYITLSTPNYGWTLEDDGDIYKTGARSKVLMAAPSLCYGYNTEGGCQLWEQPGCRNRHQKFARRSGYFSVDGEETTYRVPSVDEANSSLSPSDCREICWNDCECVAFKDTYNGCRYWRRVKNTKFVQSLDGTVAPINILVTASSSRGKIRIMLIVIGSSSTVLLFFGLVLLVRRKSNQKKMEEELVELLRSEDNEHETNSRDLRLFSYADIRSATSNFSLDNKLGQGGFGPVYKGTTAEGQDIAVKVLSRLSGQGLLEFKTELTLISKLQHVNLVKLLGCCIHGDDKMIIYEYMQNKSLDFFLFDSSEQLDWEKRFNIIEGTAQGLLYLHKYSRLRIIHRDLKPNNILLDENMKPKISDFGLARIFKQNAGEEANTNRRVGTYGYMAPEYAMQGIFSVKSDIYSFGVLVLEIVSGRRNNSFHQIEGPLNLVEYAWELWRKDSALQLIDPTLRDSCSINQLQRCIHIGLLCVENHAVDRPTIEEVISMLKNETTILPMPKSPAFITRNSVVNEVEKSTQERLSRNEVTISEIEGR